MTTTNTTTHLDRALWLEVSQCGSVAVATALLWLSREIANASDLSMVAAESLARATVREGLARGWLIETAAGLKAA